MIRPTIQFTVELSEVTANQANLPASVTEKLPFLELNVMWSTDGSFIFSIYRKSCHAGIYLHAHSYQPLFQKTSVIRNLFLRAYRYCDQQFIQDEELRIKQDFLKLGYTPKFIENCKKSATRGRRNEINIGSSTGAQTVKEKPLASLTLPYHSSMMRLRPRLSAMGIRLVFSSNSSLHRQLRRNTPAGTKPRGSVYIVNCSGCSDVYIGQSGRIAETRMGEHSRSPVSDSTTGAVHTHNKLQGHTMDLNNPTLVYRSDCYYTRVTVEAALIHIAPTIDGNTATTCKDADNLVASAICRATKLNWQKLSESIPHFKKESIPRNKRRLFGYDILRAPEHLRSQPMTQPVSARTRSQVNSRSNP